MMGIYVHIPFCDSKCAYCAFASFVVSNQIKREYFDHLQTEIYTSHENGKVDSIYFGGGTPSSVDAEFIVRILKLLKENFDVTPGAEITIECNPCSTTKQKLDAYKKAGFNRISFGVQSLDDDALSLIGRRHTSAQAMQAIALAREVGFENISADLLLSLPQGNVTSDAQKLIESGVKHISAYMLQIEDGTPLKRKVESGEIKLKDEDQTVDDYQKLTSFLQKNGLNRYEISNFAYSGCESRHNSHYWTGEKYLGFGLGAHSFDGKFIRQANACNFADYYAGKKTCESLSPKERDEEIIMLGLRCKYGFDLKKLSFDLASQPEFNKLLKQNVLNLQGTKVTLNPNFYPVSNSVIINLTKNL